MYQYFHTLSLINEPASSFVPFFVHKLNVIF